MIKMISILAAALLALTGATGANVTAPPSVVEVGLSLS